MENREEMAVFKSYLRRLMRDLKDLKKAIKEKNWAVLLELVMSYMEQAEQKFEDGATKKEWVMAMIRNSADQVNYDIDMDVVSEMIDRLCDMSNVVNPPVDEAQVANA